MISKNGNLFMTLFFENEIFYAPALPLKVVFDPTGAGDTFAGGFAGYLAQTENFSFDNLKDGVKEFADYVANKVTGK